MRSENGRHEAHRGRHKAVTLQVSRLAPKGNPALLPTGVHQVILKSPKLATILTLAFKSLVLFPGDLCELQKPAAAAVQTPLRGPQLQPEPPTEDSRIFFDIFYFGTLGESGNTLSIFICVNGWHTPTRGVRVRTALRRQSTAILLSKSSHHYKLCLNRAAPSLLILLA